MIFYFRTILRIPNEYLYRTLFHGKINQIVLIFSLRWNILCTCIHVCDVRPGAVHVCDTQQIANIATHLCFSQWNQLHGNCEVPFVFVSKYICILVKWVNDMIIWKAHSIFISYLQLFPHYMRHCFAIVSIQGTRYVLFEGETWYPYLGYVARLPDELAVGLQPQKDKTSKVPQEEVLQYNH